MKPRTKCQKEVAQLSMKLPCLTSRQKQYAIDHLFPTAILARKKGDMSCQACGHKWSDKKTVYEPKAVCPHCGKKQKIIITRNIHYKDKFYYALVTTSGNWQVIRMFHIHAYFDYRHKAGYNFQEVYQRWFTSDFKHDEVVALPMTVNSYYYDSWNYFGDLEIRAKSDKPAYNINPNSVFTIRILPTFRKFGITSDFHDFSPYFLMKHVSSDNRAETLLKTGYYEALYNMFYRYNNEQYWPSIKICLRHKYPITSEWFDYMRNLSRLGKDLRNPVYVCPENLHAAHLELVEKIHRIEERERRECELRWKIEEEERRLKQLERAKQEEAEYIKSKGKFFNINFTDKDMTIRALQSIQEFYEEGMAMHHCVFANQYYKENDSLILTARVNGERVETIEVSISQLKILQSRGKYNQNTPYHDRIISLVERNLDAIAKLRFAS